MENQETTQSLQVEIADLKAQIVSKDENMEYMWKRYQELETRFNSLRDALKGVLALTGV